MTAAMTPLAGRYRALAAATNITSLWIGYKAIPERLVVRELFRRNLEARRHVTGCLDAPSSNRSVLGTSYY